MAESRRRKLRKEVGLPVNIVLCDIESGQVLAGPSTSFLVNMSYYGAGVIIKKILFDQYHLFYTPQDYEDLVLFLNVNTDEGEALSIPIRPVWLRLHKDYGNSYFRMGIEFMADPEDATIISLEKIVFDYFDNTESLLAKLTKYLHQAF